MIVLVKIMQETLSNKVKKFIFSQKMFSVLCTPGYIKEKQEQWDSGHFFPPAWPDGIKPVFQCLHARKEQCLRALL